MILAVWQNQEESSQQYANGNGDDNLSIETFKHPHMET